MYAKQERYSATSPHIRVLEKPPAPMIGRVSLSPEFALEKKPHTVSQQSTEIRQFDLSHSFAGLPALIQRFGYQRGLFQAAMGVALNIWSLRQEMLGQMNTREVITLIKGENLRGLTFSNDLYGQAQDVALMYLHSIELAPKELQDRYALEAKQAIAVFEQLAEQVTLIDVSADRLLIEQQLQTLGFHQEEIDISPSMVANLASLRASLDSADDLHTLITQQKKLKVWIGPQQVLTVSLPHWSHHLGETGFVWVSECVVIPETGEMYIRQQGKFGKATSTDLVKYLGYGQLTERELSSEEQVMMFLNIIHNQEYFQPQVLLDWLVEQLGGLSEVGKIDRQIKEGELDIRPYFQAVMQIFDLEMQRQTHPQEIAVRLGEFSDLMKHMIARNESKAIAQLVNVYEQMIKDPRVQSPRSVGDLLQRSARQLDYGFKIPIDFSLLDCVAGTPLSLGGKMSLLSKASGMSRSDLASIVGKRAQEWKNGKKCRLCPSVGWVGECGVCLRCEMQMNGVASESNVAQSSFVQQSQDTSSNLSASVSPLIRIFPPGDSISVTEAMRIGPRQSVGLSYLLTA